MSKPLPVLSLALVLLMAGLPAGAGEPVNLMFGALSASASESRLVDGEGQLARGFLIAVRPSSGEPHLWVRICPDDSLSCSDHESRFDRPPRPDYSGDTYVLDPENSEGAIAADVQGLGIVQIEIFSHQSNSDSLVCPAHWTRGAYGMRGEKVAQAIAAWGGTIGQWSIRTAGGGCGMNGTNADVFWARG